MSHLLGNLSTGLLFVVSAPAGTGKTTLIRKLVNEFPCVVESISYTTRKIRPEEVPEKDYHFITQKEFEQKITNHEFLEYVKLYDCYYGTGLQKTQELLKQGKHVILVIDTQGALQLKRKISTISIFLKPPSLEVLKQRLIQRQTESMQVIEKRLEWAKNELAVAAEYDYCIVNDFLDTAYQVLRSIVIAEEHRVTLKTRNYEL